MICNDWRVLHYDQLAAQWLGREAQPCLFSKSSKSLKECARLIHNGKSSEASSFEFTAMPLSVAWLHRGEPVLEIKASQTAT